MLAQAEVARFLLRRELISAAPIVDGDLRIVEASRRSRNFKVISEAGPSYLLKQGRGASGRATVAHEAAVYQELQEASDGAGLRAHLPHYYGYDADREVLILELLKDAQDFREYHTRRGHFSSRMAAALGAALGDLHRRVDFAAAAERENGSRGRTPWVLSLARPDLDVFRNLSFANIQLIRIMQNVPELSRALDELRAGWRVDSLTHNDIKWDNCLFFPLPGARRKFGVKLVDWEFAGMGDSCWDAGAIFSNYLSFWLSSIPVSGEEAPDRFLELARYPLERMQPAIGAYWRAYARGRGFDAVQADEHLLRAAKYAGARLVQTGFEAMQHSTVLTGNVVCLLQLSLNVIQRPREAIAHLLGIPLSGQG